MKGRVRLKSVRPATLSHPPALVRGPRNGPIGRNGIDALLLGCGGVGSVLARQLAASGAINTLLLADVDESWVKRLAANLETDKVRALGLNASDPDAVRRALLGIRLVIHATVPRFNGPVQAAALEAGADYVDLASASRDPFVDSEAWRNAGLTALLGMGEDPGLSNVFARYTAEAMDTVEAVRIRDGDTAASPRHPFVSLFSPETFVEETLTPSRIWTDGAYVDIPPFGAPETYAIPAPVGPLPLYSVDHEETDTLPRFLGKGVRYVDFKLALDPPTLASLRLIRDLHLLEPNGSGDGAARRALFAAIPRPADLAGAIDGHAALAVEVLGRKDGVRVSRRLSVTLGHGEAFRRFGTTATAYLTATGAAIGAILLASGRIRERGKLSPEQLDPTPFFPLLRERGVEVADRTRFERPLN